MTENALQFVTGSALESELRKRRTSWITETVPAALVPERLEIGWEVDLKNKKTVRLKKRKTPARQLEDDIWAMLARVGFTDLSDGHNFTIPVTAGAIAPATKQIDVLAADGETVIVVECKTAQVMGVKSMAKDLGEANSLRGPVSQAIRQHYGIKKKVGWIFATRNIVWGKADLARADEFKIRVLTDNDLDYYLKLTALIGPAARHQLQAEIFSDQPIEGLKHTVPAVRGRVGSRRFFQFSVDPDTLLKIAFVSHRARLDADTVTAYQRMLKPAKLKAIRQYIDGGGVFPTNIVINFRSKRRFDTSDNLNANLSIGTLYLPTTYKSAWIIDGQHRLYGFAGSKWSASTQLPVLAYEQLPPDEEARMFVDINNRQTRVSQNLLVQLMSELLWDSPVASDSYYALLSRTVAVLGKQLGSPLRGRTVQEGEKQSPDRPLTTAGLYEGLRKTNLVGTIKKGVLDPGPLYEKDSVTALQRTVAVLSSYFRLFAEALPDHWARGNADGGYLCTNNGVTALLLVLEAILDHLEAYSDQKPWQCSPEEIAGMVAPFVQPIIEEFSSSQPEEIKHYRRQVGNVGQRQSSLAMMQAVHNVKPGFNPPGLAEYIKSQDQTGTNAARQLMPDLQLKIQTFTLRLLRNEFGPSEDQWWMLGVPEKVRKEVAGRREASPKRGALEQYFELIDYKTIADSKWTIFQPFFAWGEGRSKDAHLSWFQPLNDIRNRIAHPERGFVSDEELVFIQSLMDHFEKLEYQLP